MLTGSLSDVLSKIPGKSTAEWPKGEPFADVLAHGTMSVEVFAPRYTDSQTPHDQDELYIVSVGTARFTVAGSSKIVQAGDVLFVPAYADHRFHDMSEDFVTWVIFWGPRGGES
jgi:mannose-6-phosphate isomerase-like protein (cupin superfamily)